MKNELKNELVKRVIKSCIISLAISLLIWFFSFLILKNLPSIGKLFYKNEYFIRYLERMSARKRSYPIALLVCLTIVNFLLSFLLKKKKVLSIILLVVMSIVGMAGFLLLTQLNGEFVFQIIESLKETIHRFSFFM